MFQSNLIPVFCSTKGVWSLSAQLYSPFPGQKILRVMVPSFTMGSSPGALKGLLSASVLLEGAVLLAPPR